MRLLSKPTNEGKDGRGERAHVRPPCERAGEAGCEERRRGGGGDVRR